MFTTLLFSFIDKIICKISIHVKNNYISTRYITKEGIWKHLYPKHFVNVLLIHHLQHNKEKEIFEIAALMREGLSDTYQLSHFSKAQCYRSIKTHDISDIFKPFEQSDGTTIMPQVIIIDGAPGMGKTTLSKEIAYQWATSSLLDDTKLLFFLYLRDPEIHKIHYLQNFIHYYYNFDESAVEFSKQCASILINRSNDDITIILDGYDEYFDVSGDSFISKVINREVFSQSKIIITSRPTATDKLQGDIRVEVMGFTDDSKKKYIEQELKPYPGKIEKLCNYLDENKAINSICYIPMIMTLLVCMFKEIEELPADKSEIYERFIALVISRYVEKCGENSTLKILSLQNLPDTYKNYMIELARFAFETLKCSEIVFTEEDIERLCPNLSSANNDFQGLGLLKSTQYFSMKKIDNCVFYNFLHLSFQEYLAAYYINSLNPCQQFELLKNTLFVDKFTNSWTMFAGLNKHVMFKMFNYYIYGGTSCDTLKNKLVPIIYGLNPLQAFSKLVDYCINGDSAYSTQMFCFKSDEIEFDIERNKSRGAKTLISSKQLSSVTIEWNKLYLSLYSSKTGDHLLESFLIDKNIRELLYDKMASELKSNTALSVMIVSRFKMFGYRTNKQQFSDVFITNDRITYFMKLKDCNLDDEIAEVISNGIKCCNMSRVSFSGCTFSRNGSKLIFDGLGCVDTLKGVRFANMYLDEVCGAALASFILNNKDKLKVLELCTCFGNVQTTTELNLVSALQSITNLRILKFSNCIKSYNEETINAISLVISNNSTLWLINLSNNKLRAGTLKIAAALKNLSMIRYLNIRSNLVPEEAADSIASVIKSNTEIEELYLGNNKLGAGALKIVRALKEVSSLKVLDLDNNNTSSIIADDLAAVIDHNNLQKLWLANNDLRSCASTILQSLSKITTLTELNLSFNDMSAEVAYFLASAIASNTSLEYLLLSDNKFTTSGVVKIAKSLCKLSRLKVLGINNILITKEAADAVVSVISNINTITLLYLGNCYMSDEVANDLAAAIRSNCSLKVLQLKNNQLKTSGVMTICQSLQQLSTLTHFNIRNNRITGEAAECIALVILSNNRIQMLYLGDNILHNKTVVVIRALQSASSLVVLYLSNMKMTEEVAGDLVLAINNNPLLEKLYLAGNLLSSSLIEVAKACKKSTKHLIVLDLQCNCVDPSKMTDLTSVTGDINTLEALLLGGLSMSTVDQMFDKFLCHLEILNLHGTKVDLESFGEYRRVEMLNMEIQKSSIAHTFKLNYQLSYIPYDTTDTLHIDLFNPQQVIDQHSFLYNLEKVEHKVNATIMIQSLSVISTLKVLDLEHSNVDETAAFELATKLCSNYVLQQLWLGGNKLNTAGAMFISNSLKCMSTLQVLDLSFNNIGYQSADNVAAVIYSNPTLEQLWLDGNGLLDTGVMQICRALKRVTKLRILSLCSNGISDDSAEELSAAISSNNLLEDLLLGNNNLQSVGIYKIVHSLSNLVKLRKLDLFHNGVTKEAVDELAVIISNCYTLQELYLSDNMLGTIEAVKIFESLKHKSKLQVLTLSNNNITDEVIGELCFVLARNPRLQVLLIGGNKLQTDGVITIAGVVKCENTIMNLLALCENDVSEQGKEQVKMMFSDNPDIHVYV